MAESHKPILLTELTISDILVLTSNESLTSLTNDCCRLISKFLNVGDVQFISPSENLAEMSEHTKEYNVAKDGNLLGIIRVSGRDPDRNIDDSYIYPLLALLANQITLLNRCANDLLTGLYNRQALDERFKEVFTHGEFSEQRKVVHNRVLAVIDIDHFKQVNDTYGHLYGDEILVLFSGILKTTFRDEDWLFRYGGDEFVIVMNDATLANAAVVIDRLRVNVARHPFPKVENVTMSIGYTCIEPKLGVGEVFDRADHALYHVKKLGRDGACSYEDLESKGLGKGETFDSDDIELF